MSISNTGFNNLYLKMASCLPKKIEELSEKQFVFYSILMSRNKLYEEGSRMLFLSVLCKELPRYYRFLLRLCSYDQLEELSVLTDWIFSIPGTDKVMLPVIGSRKNKLYGPWESFYNISWGDYRNACDYLTLYSQNYDMTYLDNMIAVLYVLKNDPETAKSYSTRVGIVKKLPIKIKYAILHNFCLLIKKLPENYPHVYKTIKDPPKKPSYWHKFMKAWMKQLNYQREDWQKKDKLMMVEVLEELEEMYK